jgi:uncharacterized membrane-anchored protein YitT (DUF2179 family)
MPDRRVGHFSSLVEYTKLEEREIIKLKGRTMYKQRVKYYESYSRSAYISIKKRLLYIFCGASLVGVSLQLLLVKNSVIDGGIVGLSIILFHTTGIDISLFLLILNTPFFILGYSYLGRRFLILSLFAISVLSLVTHFSEPFPSLTENPFIVTVLGGFTLGLGVGIVIRFGGSLDGTEVLAILLSKRTSYSIGKIVMFFNIFILGSSVFIFGIKEAVVSLATFFIAYKTIDVIIK